jgi:hypothetical protein
MIAPVPRMKISLLLAFVLLMAGLSASKATASEFDEFGFESVSAELSTTAAGQHPDLTTQIILNHRLTKSGLPIVTARAEEVSVALPPGLTGNPQAFPRCSTGDFIAFGACSADSQVGVVKVQLNEGDTALVEPLYNLEPPHPGEELGRLGFIAVFYPVFIDLSVRTGSDYGVTATIRQAPGQGPIVSAATVIWGDPTSASHDKERLTPIEALQCPGTACLTEKGGRKSELTSRPFLTNPSACQQQVIRFGLTSYQLPGQRFSAEAPLPPITDCGVLPFGPSLDIEPTSHAAGQPTGLEASLRIPQVEDVDLPAASSLKDAIVALPPGMTVSPGAANGMLACSAEEVGLGKEAPASCPTASQLGTMTVVSPPLPGPLGGTIYLRTPERGHQFRIWLVTEGFGIDAKIPGEIEPNALTGQLTARLQEIPQLPIEEIDLLFKGGPKAPLKNPDACGTYSAHYEFAPWSGGAAANGDVAIAVDGGCPAAGFSPKLSAGVTNPIAGAHSSFTMRLTRNDGENNLGGFEVTLPEGLLAKLARVPLCAAAEATAGTCPLASRIGSLDLATGSGSVPLWIPQPGKPAPAAFLAGPYKGAPYSIVTEVPAQAGSFDFGTVVVRSGLFLDPVTSRVTVRTDPLPQIVEGVPLLYRDLHIDVDRPGFVLNPTDCREMAVESTVTSVEGAVAHPANRFQVDGCAALKFKPTLSLRLKGGTSRGEYPALSAVVKARRGDANIARAVVSLPHAEFLAQEHLGTICTRVRFAAGKCPAGSVYGWARAWSPLLDKPLAGPVFLRSSDHVLPDLVAHLHGQVDIDLVGRIGSEIGGIRTTFAAVPDAPLKKFVLKMKGGKKSLLVNSRDLCGKRVAAAAIQMAAQNGRSRNFHAPLNVRCPRNH